MAKPNGSQQTAITSPVPTGFDQVLHLRYRLFLPALLGHQTLAVYDALRSCIWRQDLYGPEALISRTQRGYLAAQVPQSHLSLMTGVARTRVNMHLKRLETLGWVSSLGGQKTGGPKVYELGVRRPQHGVWAEVPYADTVMTGWYEAVEGVSQARWGCHYRRLAAADQYALVSEVLQQGGVTRQRTGGVIRLASAFRTGGVTGGVTSFAAGGVTGGGVTTSDTLAGAHAQSFPVAAHSNAAAFAFIPAEEGGVTSDEGGVTPADRGVAESAPNEPTDARKSLIFRDADAPDSRGEVSPGKTARCHPGRHENTFNVPRKSAKLRENPAQNFSHIDSSHRMTSPYGEGLDTSYLSLPSSGEVRCSGAVALEPKPNSTARKLAVDFDFDSAVDIPFELDVSQSNSSTRPASQTPKPPAPRAPLSPDPEFSALAPEPVPGGVTPSPNPSPEVPCVAARKAPEDIDPGLPPSRTAENATTAPTVRSAPGLAAVVDLAAVVEEAKAKSRAAMEAKLAKQRAKDQKRANLSSDASYRAQKTAAMRIEEVWREEMKAAFPDIPQIAWFKRERGGKVLARKEGKLMADLIDGYGGDEAAVTNLVRVFVKQWGVIGPMLTKTKDGVPTLGLLYACHATVMVEARKYAQPKASPVEAYEAWMREHGGDSFARPPAELEAAYLAAKAKKGKP